MDARRLSLLAAGAVGTLSIVAALYHQAAQPPGHMEASAFARTARQLRSDAEEAARIADALHDGLLTSHFALGRSKKLGEDVDDLVKDLEAPGPDGKPDSAEAMLVLAARVKGDLLSLPSSMADRDALAQLADAQRAKAGEIGRLGKPDP